MRRGLTHTLATSGRSWMVAYGAMIACSWGGNQFTPLLLLYKQEAHYTTLTVNLLLGIYVLGLAPALLVSGALSDRYGRRPVMLAGVVAAIAGSTALACGGPFGVSALFVGRLLSGVTVGVAMAVGTSWVKELSQPPLDPGADVASGARRSSMAFTLGSALGALVAGGIAQLTPWGQELPYLVQIVVSLPFLFLVRGAPETSEIGARTGPLWRQLRVPSARHRRFGRVVLAAAPFLFVAAALAYGYLPVLLGERTGGWGIGYATVLSVVTLGMATLVQPLAKRAHSLRSARGLALCLMVIALGTACVAFAVTAQSLLLGALASIVLGAGMGIGLVSGLLEVQRIAGARDLAGLTGDFYAVAYTGFLAPTVLAALTSLARITVLLACVTGLAVLALVFVLAVSRKYLPRDESEVPLPAAEEPDHRTPALRG